MERRWCALFVGPVILVALVVVPQSTLAGLPLCDNALVRQSALNAWLVLPSGDLSGGTDAQNLACAFASAAVGDTVQLAAGSFYVNRTLDVVDFSGTVTGTKDALGNNMTILRDANAPGVVFEGFPVRGNVWDVLMVFRLETASMSAGSSQ